MTSQVIYIHHTHENKRHKQYWYILMLLFGAIAIFREAYRLQNNICKDYESHIQTYDQGPLISHLLTFVFWSYADTA